MLVRFKVNSICIFYAGMFACAYTFYAPMAFLAETFYHPITLFFPCYGLICNLYAINIKTIFDLSLCDAIWS